MAEDMDFFKNKTINKTIPIPLYYQLKQILFDYIQENNIAETLPSEVDLCEHFDVSRPTVRQAIKDLASEGYLLQVKGKGTQIIKKKIEQHYLYFIESFQDEMQHKGLANETKTLNAEIVLADNLHVKTFGVDSLTDIIRLERLRTVNSEPIVHIITFLPGDRFKNLNKMDLENNSLYKVLEEEYDCKIKRSRRTVEAIKADENIAELLNIPEGDPIHFIKSEGFTEDDEIVELTFASYRGDKNKFLLELRREAN